MSDRTEKRTTSHAAGKTADRALIIGGGIGGLAAALALRRLGFDPVVFERFSEAPPGRETWRGGAGISLWSNAVRALQKLDLAEAVIASGTIVERVATFNRLGELLDETDIEAHGRRYGAPSVCIRRSALLDILSAALPPGIVRASSECTGYSEDAEGVIARFQDGTEERGAFVVGADGIHSVIRAQLRGKAAPRYAGYTCWRGMAEFSAPELSGGRAIVVTGPGCQFGLFPCGAGQAYWFCTRNSPSGLKTPSGSARGSLLEWIEGWPAPIRTAIEATPDDEILQNDILDRAPIWPWGRGRVTLLGDAAHPATPNLGQGACQALEDAVVLAFSLRRVDDKADCLRIYETWRRFPTAKIIRRSRMMGRMLQWQLPLAVAARDRLVNHA